jgi:hypothetical protein
MSAVERLVREQVDTLLSSAQKLLLQATAQDASAARAQLAQSTGDVDALLKAETADPRRLRVRVLQDGIKLFAETVGQQVEDMASARVRAEQVRHSVHLPSPTVIGAR